MAKMKFFIEGNETDTKPVEFEDLQVSVDWTGSKQVQIDFDKLTWRNSPTDDIASRIIAMRSDNIGRFNGRPFEISVNGYNLPKMMINLRDDFKQVSNIECEVKIEVVNQKDVIARKASVIQFRRLELQGKFLPTDFVQVPYNINYVPDAMQVLMISITIFNLSKTAAELIKEIANSIGEFITAVIPAVGAGAVITVGQIILAILKLILRIAYFVMVAIAIGKLVKQLAEQLYPATRYHTSVKIASLFRVLCKEMNLVFVSDLMSTAFASQLVIMPTKTEKGRKNKNITNYGTPSSKDAGLYFGGEFIESMMQLFNADYRISNGQLRFERWDWWKNNSTETLDSNWSNQQRRMNEITDNAADFKGGYFLAFQFDQEDRNTIDKIYGSSYDVITTPSTTLGEDYNLAYGSTVIDFPLSYGIRKDNLNNFELLLKGLFKAVDKITSKLGNGTNLMSALESRKGNLQLSNHFTSKPKLLLMEGNKGLAANQQLNLNAKVFWDNYHYINSFYPINGVHNQWENYKMRMKINSSLFESLVSNNFLKDANGNDVEIEKISWTIYKDTAEVEYRVNNQYDFSLQQQYVIAENSPLSNTDV